MIPPWFNYCDLCCYKMLQHSGTGCRWRNFDRPCYWLIRQSDTWNVMHLLALSLLSKDVQTKPACHFHYFKHNHNPTNIWFVCGSFPHCEALAPLLPRISPSSTRSTDGACWRGPLVGLNCWWCFSMLMLCVCNLWMAFLRPTGLARQASLRFVHQRSFKSKHGSGTAKDRRNWKDYLSTSSWINHQTLTQFARP